jgi:alpha-mannosidase
MVQWRYNIVSDNGPVDSTLSDFVRDWNEKYASPR